MAQPGQAIKMDEKSAKVIGTGSGVAALFGLVAVVLTIIGVQGTMPTPLCGFAALAAGIAMVLEGGAIASRFGHLRAGLTAASGQRGEVLAETGMTAEMIGGLVAIVLAILALMRVGAMTLLPVAAIVLGATILLGSGETYETIEMPVRDAEAADTVAPTGLRAATNAAGADILIGIAGITLGILGLVHVGGQGVLLSLVALLLVGFGELVSDTTLAARISSIPRGK